MNGIRRSGHVGALSVLLIAAVAIVAATTADAQTSANATAAKPQVSFTKDIVPILQDKCQTCHRTGSIAPMPLTTYQETRPWAKDIKQRVLTRSMPPWFIDKHVGIQHFANDISLSDEQIAMVAKWVDEGAPQGDPKDMPPPKVFEDDGPGWQLAKMMGHEPDMVLEGPDYTVKAHDQDQWFDPTTDVSLTEPRWVMAVEMKTSTLEARQVFHHITANLEQDETNAPSAQVKVSLGASADVSGGGAMGGLLMEYAIGKNYDIFRAGTGKLLMPGAKIHWEYHTHGGASDKDITAHSQLGIYLYPRGQTPKYRTYHESLQANNHRTDLSIAPNSIHVEQGFTLLRAAARLENFQPHMHMRGKAMELAAILPDGSTQVLNYVGNFNFNWMVNHIYADDAAPVLPRGTIIRVTAWHDNTSANPNNPDPNQWVGYSERSVDEMAHAHVNVTYITDQDYADWAAAHLKKSPAAAASKQEGGASTEPSAINR